MKRRTKIFISLLAVLALTWALAAACVHREGRTDYAMGGTVTVIGKERTATGDYSMTIEQGGVGGRYTLTCTKEQFDRVRIGEMIRCERYQSEITHKGRVHSIKKP